MICVTNTNSVIVQTFKATIIGDILDLDIVSRKIQCVGVKDSITDLFESYFSNRKSFISLKNVLADAGLLYCGAPQESTFGTLPFLIYSNDILKSVKKKIFNFENI